MGRTQGSPLSPILGNIMLNELDRELERRGHRFVRHVDDLVIFCKSCRLAGRTLDNLLPFIEKKLFLKVNREKTKVTYMCDIKFLYYAFSRSNDKCIISCATVFRRMKAKIRDRN
ncbi:MAG: hypothetical protein LBH04_03365 [Tannerellaceae bacterium]|nr:hypothetical protein [Tannerellaceae bacterium]